MITSTYPFDYDEYLEFNAPAKLSRKRRFLSEVLKRHGYSTAFFHDNPYLSSAFGYSRGFDLVVDFGAAPKGGLSRPSIKQLFFSTFKNKQVRKFFWRAKDYVSFLKWYFQDSSLHANAETLLSEAHKWVEAASSPYFLWLHFMDAHIPYTPKHEILEKFGIHKFNALHVVSKHFFSRHKKPLTDEEADLFERLYDAQIYRVDQALAECLLKMTSDNFDNTYIVITADHGEEFSDRTNIGHHINVLTDELLHVPLLIIGGELKTSIIDAKASLVDLAPTILDLLKIDKPTSFKGASLLKGNASPLIVQGIFKGKRHQRAL
jgi:arylsulfatase A-like enzyme